MQPRTKQPRDGKLGDALAIRRIRIEKLFGHYTYDLRCEASLPDASRLLILYGDNGSGKTTILKMAFNLLSYVDKQGHKTYLAHLPFKKVIIDLGPTTQVVAFRSGKSVIGSYTAYVRRHRRIVARILFTTDKDNDIVRPLDPRVRTSYERRVQHFLKTLQDLKLALFFITDDRQLLQNIPRQRRLDESSPRLIRRIRALRPAPDLRGRYLDEALTKAIALAVEWVKEQVLSGSKQGEADAYTIYANIVHTLASESGAARRAERTNIRKLTATLQEQAGRSNEFAKFGFPSAPNIIDLIKSLTRARKDLATIYKIVGPFVDTAKARLDALQEVQESVSGLVETINAFFKDKKLEFDLGTGISIRAYDGAPLPLSNLSSGEKQLLLLFCSTLITRDEEAIYLVDEPEISLNIKWQRHLIQSLLDLTRKRRVQFILATHSFELFAPHHRNVLPLSERAHDSPHSSAATNTSRIARHPQA